MSILHDLQRASESVVDCLDLKWRVRKISAGDAAAHGLTSMMLLPEIAAMATGAKVAPKPPTPDATETEPDPEASTLEKITQAMARVNPAKLEQLWKHRDALICAGLVAVWANDDDGWTPCKAVPHQTQANPDEGLLWVVAIPDEVKDALMAEILKLSINRGDAERLRRFRSGTGGG